MKTELLIILLLLILSAQAYARQGKGVSVTDGDTIKSLA